MRARAAFAHRSRGRDACLRVQRGGDSGSVRAAPRRDEEHRRPASLQRESELQHRDSVAASGARRRTRYRLGRRALSRSPGGIQRTRHRLQRCGEDQARDGGSAPRAGAAGQRRVRAGAPRSRRSLEASRRESSGRAAGESRSARRYAASLHSHRRKGNEVRNPLRRGVVGGEGGCDTTQHPAARARHARWLADIAVRAIRGRAAETSASAPRD